MRHSRIDQLSDGIFAIVMTVLVFEINVPIFTTSTNTDLWLAIKDLGPHFASYLISFALLFTYWRAHHFFISVYAKNIDTTLSNINAVFFLLITLVPFSSSLLGQFSANELAIALFGLHIILIGLTLAYMRRYVLYSDHIKNPEISAREIHGSTVRILVPVVFAIIAILVSFINTNFSILLFAFIVVFNLSSYSTRLFGKIFGIKSG